MGLRSGGSGVLVGLGRNVLWARAVWAGLGGDAASVLAASNQMQGVVHSYSSPQFDIQEITTENGIRVREFVDRDGLVFAIAWSGPAEPNLQQLLGVHFAPYHQARMAQTPPGLHRALRLAPPDLSVDCSGPLRAHRCPRMPP